MTSSFNLGLYIQFMYDGPLFNECLIIGISARLVTYSSLWLYATRTLYAIILVIVYLVTKEENPVLNHWNIQTADVDQEAQCSNRSETFGYGSTNDTFHTDYVIISESMCIASGNTKDIPYKLAYPKEGDLFMWLLISILE